MSGSLTGNSACQIFVIECNISHQANSMISALQPLKLAYIFISIAIKLNFYSIVKLLNSLSDSCSITCIIISVLHYHVLFAFLFTYPPLAYILSYLYYFCDTNVCYPVQFTIFQYPLTTMENCNCYMINFNVSSNLSVLQHGFNSCC